MRKSFGYLTKEGFKNIWANRLMSLASIGVLVACMAIIGIAMILTSNLNVAMSTIEKENVVMAYMNDKNSVLYPIDGSAPPTDKNVPDSAYKVHNEEEAKKVCESIGKLGDVEKVEYVSAEQALENYKKNYVNGDSQYLVYFEGEDNPMPMGAKITLKSLDNFSAVVKQIEAVDGVNLVVSSKVIASTLIKIRNAVETARLSIIIVLMIISLVIVSNTIRVTMYNRKLEISIMKAVGATDWFIRWPFLIEGVILGIFSAVISLGFTYGIYHVAAGKIIEAIQKGSSIHFSVIAFRKLALPIFGVFVAIGVLAGIIGSIIILSKYLKKEGSEFRAI